jgi:hypothetical protein
VRIVDEHTLAFQSYDGDGMYLSLGNVLRNPQVGLLFLDLARPKRLRVNGDASIDEADPLPAAFTDAQLVVRVRATDVLPSCPPLRAPDGARGAVARRPPRGVRDAEPRLEATRTVARRAAGRRSGAR